MKGMTQEDKQLILVDICARLPYDLIVDRLGVQRKVLTINPYNNASLLLDRGKYRPAWCSIDDVKPYLRPMSSMTEEERKEYKEVMFQSLIYEGDYAIDIDWLNKKMFDYRSLIPKGLALEAPEGMYGKEEQQ